MPLRTVLAASLFLSFVAGCAETTSNASAGYSYQAEVHPPADGTPPPVATAQPEPAQPAAQDDVDDDDPQALSDAQATLTPYGVWYDDPTYGTVWTPHASVVGASFSPYMTAGHWAYGDDYVWVSDYDWGWLPFHYGRWTYIGGRGWAWSPGRVYRGAWVDWRTGGDGYGYVGWSPMAPRHYWRGGVAVGFGPGYVATSSPYFYAPTHSVFAPTISAHVVTGPQVSVIHGSTRAWGPSTVAYAGVGTRGYYAGPPPRSLGIQSASVVTVPQGHVGISRAQAYARPSYGGPGYAGGRVYAQPGVSGASVGTYSGRSGGVVYGGSPGSPSRRSNVSVGGGSHPTGGYGGRPGGSLGGRTFSTGGVRVGR